MTEVLLVFLALALTLASALFVAAEFSLTTVERGELERAAAGAGFSRFPVTGPTGTVVGYLHIKDTLGVMDRDQPFPRSAVHAVNRVQTDTPLDDALSSLRASGSHLAAVTGDAGRVLGFVTMEDVLGELVGPAA